MECLAPSARRKINDSSGKLNRSVISQAWSNMHSKGRRIVPGGFPSDKIPLLSLNDWYSWCIKPNPFPANQCAANLHDFPAQYEYIKREEIQSCCPDFFSFKHLLDQRGQNQFFMGHSPGKFYILFYILFKSPVSKWAWNWPNCSGPVLDSSDLGIFFFFFSSDALNINIKWIWYIKTLHVVYLKENTCSSRNWHSQHIQRGEKKYSEFLCLLFNIGPVQRRIFSARRVWKNEVLLVWFQEHHTHSEVQRWDHHDVSRFCSKDALCFFKGHINGAI